MGTSTRPVFTIRPARANTLVPLLLPMPSPAYQSAPLRMIAGTFANVSTLLMSVGQSHSPWTAGYGGRGLRRAAAAFDRRDERGLLAAHERARAEADLDVEGERGVADAGAQPPGALCLADGGPQAGHRERVLGPAVDVALRGVDREGRDGHPLEDPVRVALEDAAVHERTRVALVGVADDVLLGALGLGDRGPLEAGRVAGTAAAAQAAAGDLLADRRWRSSPTGRAAAPRSRPARGSRRGSPGRPARSSRWRPGPASRRRDPAAGGCRSA